MTNTKRRISALVLATLLFCVLFFAFGAIGTSAAANKARVTTLSGETAEYATLEEAFDSLKYTYTPVATVTLLTDVDLENSVSTPHNCTTILDLAGHTVNGTVLFKGNDVIIDTLPSPEAERGKINGSVMIDENATLRINGGAFTTTSDYPIYVSGNAIINDAHIYTPYVGGTDILVGSNGNLLIKNAEFPIDGIDIADYRETVPSIRDYIDSNASYYEGSVKVESTDERLSYTAVNDISAFTSIKQDYVAKIEQEGKETLYIYHTEAITDAIFSFNYFEGEAYPMDEYNFSEMDADLPAKLTIYNDSPTAFSHLQNLKQLTIDLNGNAIYNIVHRVTGGGLNIIDSSPVKTGTLINYMVILNEYNEATDNTVFSTDVNTSYFSVTLEDYSKATISGGKHLRLELGVFDVFNEAKITLSGGSYGSVKFNTNLTEGYVPSDYVSISNISFEPAHTNFYFDMTDFSVLEVIEEGYVLQYSDGRYETDNSKVVFYEPFSVNPHTHEYTINDFDTNTHFMKCECGEIEASSIATHTYDTENYEITATHHTISCDSCDFVLLQELHDGVPVVGSYDESTDMHMTECSVCGHNSYSTCSFYWTDTYNGSETEMGYHRYSCDCGYYYYETFCYHLAGYTYLQQGTDSDMTHIYGCPIDGCTERSTQSCNPVYNVENSVPPTEVSVGYDFYECVCGYSYQETFCEHRGDKSYTKIGTDEDATHSYVCLIDGCGETLASEACAVGVIEDVAPTETSMGYTVWVCDCGYSFTDYYCWHIGDIEYTKIGTDEDATHSWTCKIEGCGETVEEECYPNVIYTHPTLTEAGYYTHSCDCGYSYRTDGEPALETIDIVTVGGIPMNFTDAIYYVNGNGGAPGTTHATEPEVWHAKLEYDFYETDGSPVITLILNGLNITTENIAAIEAHVFIDIYLAPGTSNSVTLNTNDGLLGAIEGKGLAIAMDSDEAVSSLNVSANGAIGFNVEELSFHNAIVNVNTAKTAISTSYLSVYNSKINIYTTEDEVVDNIISAVYFYIDFSSLKIDIPKINGSFHGIFCEQLYVLGSDVTIKCGEPNPDKEEEIAIEAIYGNTIDISSDSKVIIEAEKSDLFVGISAHNYLDIIDSSVIIRLSSVSLYAVGISSSEGIASIDGSDVSISLNSTNNASLGGISLTLNDSYYHDHILKIKNSTVDLTLSGQCFYVSGIDMKSKLYGPIYDLLVIEKSVLNIDSSEAFANINSGIAVTHTPEELAHYTILRITDSDVNVKYGYGKMFSYGISIQASSYDGTVKEALIIEDSSVSVIGRIITDEEIDTLSLVPSWSNEAIAVDLFFEDVDGEALVSVKDSSLTAISGNFASETAGISIYANDSEDASTFHKLFYAKSSSITAIGGDAAATSIGINLYTLDSYAEFGIYLDGCELLAKSGNALLNDSEEFPLPQNGYSVAMFLCSETGNELLYIEGGRTVLIAPEGFEINENDITKKYNVKSYALYLDGDDGEIVSGTLEMYAGTFAVWGDMDTKNNVFPLGSEEYNDDIVSNDYEKDIRYEETEEDTPKYVLFLESEFYIAGLPMFDGQYYVNGKYGSVGKIYDEEPEKWNAKLEAIYDEDENIIKFVLTLDGLYISENENSLLPYQILSLCELDIVLTGEESVIETNSLNEYYAPYNSSYAISVRSIEISSEERENHPDGYTLRTYKKNGKATLSGSGKITADNSASGDIYVDMDSFLLNGSLTEKNLTAPIAVSGEAISVESHTHTVSDWIIDKAATCTENGSRHKACTVCGTTTETEEITAIGHAYGEFAVITEPDKKESGLREKTCANCGDKVSELIPAIKTLPTGAVIGITAGASTVTLTGGFSLFWFVIKKKKWFDLIH